MKNTVRFILLILCCSVLTTGYCQDATLADLMQVTAKLRVLKTYSYQTETEARFPNGKTDRMKTEVYMDGPGKRLCYKTNQQVLLLTGKWAFKADHRNKRASVFDVVKYNARFKEALPELDEIFRSNLAANYLDSLVMKKAKLQSAKRSGAVVTYKLGFPPDFYIKEMTIAYNKERELPEQIRIVSFYADGRAAKPGSGTTYETVCKGYSKTVPEAVFDTQQYFRMAGAKVQLQQFKNYKLSAIL